MEGIVRRLKWSAVSGAVINIAVGAACLFWTEMTAELICTVLAWTIIVTGGIMILSYFLMGERVFASSFLLFTGVIVAVVGLWILTHQNSFIGLIPKIAGLIMLVSGITNLLQALSLLRSGYGRWWTGMLTALVTVIAGLVLFTRAAAVTQLVIKVIGACLLYNGVSDLWLTGRVAKTLHDAEKDAEALTVDAVEVDDKP